jgi:hypothetical protein
MPIRSALAVIEEGTCQWCHKRIFLVQSGINNWTWIADRKRSTVSWMCTSDPFVPPRAHAPAKDDKGNMLRAGYRR